MPAFDSTYTVHDKDENGTQLTFDIFYSRADAEAFIAKRQADIARCGYQAVVIAHPYPVRYIITDLRAVAEGYLGFGARPVRVEAMPHPGAGNWVILSVPAEHTAWQAMRLQSGLHGASVHDTLDDAQAFIARWQQQANSH
jgi:hypothetical protein